MFANDYLELLLTATVLTLPHKALAFLIFAALLVPLIGAGESLRKRFAIPQSDASESLQLFVAQSGEPLIYLVSRVHGVKTNKIQGKFKSRDALERLLRGTDLVPLVDDELSVVFINRVGVETDDSEPLLAESVSEKPQTKTEMQRIKKDLRSLLQMIAASAAIGATGKTLAQGNEDDGAFYELSPFVVEANENEGYRATSTLAGTRLKTKLEDVASAVSVVTQEMLDDTGSTNARDILVYTTGTEVTGVGGNFSGSASRGTHGSFSDSSETNRTQPGTRVRGLASADLARDYFASSIPFDSYNTTSVEINRGSNAVLFGLGSPAGIINNSLKKASFADSNEVEFMLGRFGTSRAVIDVNRVLIDDVLSVRVAGMYEDEKYQQDPAFERDERIYGALTFRKDLLGAGDDAWGTTTVRANIENGSITANRPRTTPPIDLVTPWFTPYTDHVLGGVNLPAKITWDPSTQDNSDFVKTEITDPNNPYADNQRLSHHVTVGGRHAYVFYPEHSSSVARAPGADGLVGRNIVNDHPRGEGTGGVTWMFAPTSLRVAIRDWRPDRDDWPFWFTPVMTDESIFDFRNQLMDGPNKGESADFEAHNLSIEQLFFNNKAGIEIAFNSEEFSDSASGILDPDARSGISIDLNTHFVDGLENPNFGRPFYGGESYFTSRENERDTFRVTGFGELDFAGKSDGWKKWLGRHTVTGLYSSRTTDTFSSSGRLATLGADYIYGRNGNRSADNRIMTFHYLGPSLANLDSPVGANIPNLQAIQRPTADSLAGGLFWLTGHNRIIPGSETGERVLRGVENAVTREISVLDGPFIRGANRSNQEVDSSAFVLQSYLLNENLVGTVSWRQDDFEFRTVTSFDRDAAQNAIIDEVNFSASGDANPLIDSQDTVTWGGVLKVPHAWLEGVPVLSAVNFHYGVSENFQPTSQRTGPFGDLLAPPSGETTDYGISMRLFEDKLSLRATWYETNQVGVSTSVFSHSSWASAHGQVLDATIFTGLNQNLDPSDPEPELDIDGDGTIDVHWPKLPADYAALHNFQFDEVNGFSTNPRSISSTQDLASEGFEFELIYNPTENWRIMFNASQQEAATSNVGKDMIRWYTEVPFLDLDEDGVAETTLQDAVNGPLAPFEFSAAGNGIALWAQGRNSNVATAIARDGQPTRELREWRWNVLTNYQFSDGKFKGFNVGGAARWSQGAAIGYPVIRNEFDDPVQDFSRPFNGDDRLVVDGFIGYERPLMDGKLDWNVQLNVRNLLNDDDLIEVAANPDGRVVGWAIPTPMTWQIRNTFRF